jgi:hypothetical protein
MLRAKEEMEQARKEEADAAAALAKAQEEEAETAALAKAQQAREKEGEEESSKKAKELARREANGSQALSIDKQKAAAAASTASDLAAVAAAAAAVAVAAVALLASHDAERCWSETMVDALSAFRLPNTDGKATAEQASQVNDILAAADGDQDGTLTTQQFVSAAEQLGIQLPSTISDSLLELFADEESAAGNLLDGVRLRCSKLKACLCGEGDWHTAGNLLLFVGSQSSSALLSQSGEWREVACTLAVDGIRCDEEGEELTFVRFGPGEVPLEPLPDSARKSKHSRLFPFKLVDHEGRPVLLAAATGAEMWRWCIAIRRRFRGPLEEGGAEGWRLKEAFCVATNMHSPISDTDVKEAVEAMVQGAGVDTESMEDYSFLDRAGAHYASELMTRKYTALGLASLGGQQKFVELLLSRGADPNYVRPNGMTALFWLCEGPFTPARTELANTLIGRGASVEATARTHVTPDSDPEWHCIAFLFRFSYDDGTRINPADKELARVLVSKGAGRQSNAKVRVERAVQQVVRITRTTCCTAEHIYQLC